LTSGWNVAFSRWIWSTDFVGQLVRYSVMCALLFTRRVTKCRFCCTCMKTQHTFSRAKQKLNCAKSTHHQWIRKKLDAFFVSALEGGRWRDLVPEKYLVTVIWQYCGWATIPLGSFGEGKDLSRKTCIQWAVWCLHTVSGLIPAYSERSTACIQWAVCSLHIVSGLLPAYSERSAACTQWAVCCLHIVSGLPPAYSECSAACIQWAVYCLHTVSGLLLAHSGRSAACI